MDFEVPALPYAKDALEPAMSAETLEFHYEKHHKGYMGKLKAALDGKPEASKSLDEIVKSSSGGVFNNSDGTSGMIKGSKAIGVVPLVPLTFFFKILCFI